MKYQLVLLLASLISCQSSDDDTLVFLNKGVEMCNTNLNSFTDEYYSRFEAAMQENPTATEPHKQKVDSIKETTNKLVFIIDSIQQAIIEKNDTVEDISYLFDSPEDLNTQLQSVIEEYNKLIIHLNNADSVLLKLDFNFRFPIETTNTKSNILTLNRLVNEIHLINHHLVSAYYKKISEKDFSFRKFVPVLIPKNRFLRTGDIYEAKMFLATTDTIVELQMVTRLDTIYSRNGKISFKRNTVKLGKHLEGAVIGVKQPRTGKILTYPFKIKYKVINKQ